ncbi:hypothetical protein B7P43_G15953 [Cryptotermes secundus]|uniref:Enoyl reductase (ER) domain-containing protein n=1 Tax=Cryptotermes secundus TaxID=105785 RepID=A0A2J7RGI9_9NEOP|nr:hypothetical protein B7P43_G15953 [Cryptotermes secundus]PNF39955.1 hypothetical protein B7P43_G15953 [Cryptotermes secundus]
MDEVLFHVTQSLEALQVHLHSGAQYGHHLLHNYSEQVHTYAVEIWSGPRCAQIQENIQHAWQWLLKCSQELRRISLDVLNLQQLYGQLMRFLGAEMSRTSMYFGLLGFVLGGVVGVAVGLSWQKKQPHVPQMKAVVCNSYRGSDALIVIEDVPVPVITVLDEVLVQVKAASVDLVDLKICSGYGRVLRKQLSRYNNNVVGEFPVVLGRDCAGIIVDIGQKVNKFEIGDEVWFAVPYWMPGTMAEYVVVKERHIARKPKGIGFEIATSIPYAGTVAWDALVNQAHLDSVKTCDKRFDVIFNTEGSVAYQPCLKFCKPGGFVVSTETSELASDSYGFLFRSIYAFWIRIRCLIQDPFLWEAEKMGPAVLDQLAQLLEDGSLQPVVDKMFAPQDAELAFQHADSSEAIGKTIIRFRFKNGCRCGAYDT